MGGLAKYVPPLVGVSRCQKIFVKHNLCFMKHKIKPAASTAAEKIWKT